jgi:hypothetical protein
MDITVDGLMEQARQLSLEEQAILSERLYEMLSPPDPEWEAEWIAECQDRVAAIERGEMDLLDSDEVMERLRRKHGLK